jgi:hypothetical protein
MHWLREIIRSLLSGGRGGLGFTPAQLAIGGLIAVAAASVAIYNWPRGGQEQVYVDPRTGGKWVDHCLRWAADCDGPAATAWCKLQPPKWSHSPGSSWQFVGATEVTHLIGEGRDCVGAACGRFNRIVCAK